MTDTVRVAGETYIVSAAQKAEFDRLVAMFVAPATALAIATGTFEDIDPPGEPDAATTPDGPGTQRPEGRRP